MVRIAFLYVVTATATATASPVFATDAQTRMIEQACGVPEAYSNLDQGVMQPREIQCRARMGQSYSEIEKIAVQRQARFQQREQEEDRAAMAQAEKDRAIGLASCKRLVAEYEEGVYYQEGTETLAILNWLDKGTTSKLIERLQQFPENNAREEDYKRLEWPLEILRDRIRSRAYSGREYEANKSGRVLRSPGAVAFSLNCFYNTKFGGLRTDSPKLTKDPY